MSLTRHRQLARKVGMPAARQPMKRTEMPRSRPKPPKAQADVYAHARARSQGRCEALWAAGGQWSRCTRTADEPQHRITRARGGLLLDAVGETGHVVALCHACHRDADGGPAGIACRGRAAVDGQLVPLLASGQVRTDKLTGEPYYVGPDEWFAERYPAPNRRITR